MTSQTQLRADQKAFLVLSGSNPRAVITFLRVLKRLGQRIVIIARSEDDQVFLSGFKHAVMATRKCDNLDLEDIKNCIEEARRRTGIKEFVICPSSEFLNLFLLTYRDTLKGINCHLPLVEESIYKKVSNKSSSVKMVTDHGLNTPQEFSCPEKFTRPLIAKPIVNIDESWQSLYPVFLLDAESFAGFVGKSDIEAYFFQEYVSGDSFYLFAHISESGDMRLASQKNLAQQADGKSIVLAESTDFHLSETAQKTIQMLKDEKFYGLVMVEFIECDGRYYFIEINPRLWGPLQLVVAAKSGVVRSFICDSLGLSVSKDMQQPRGRCRKVRYLWSGGFAIDQRAGNTVQWREIDGFKRFILVVRSLFSDVYFKKDSWRIFLSELSGLKNDKPQVEAIE